MAGIRQMKDRNPYVDWNLIKLRNVAQTSRLAHRREISTQLRKSLFREKQAGFCRCAFYPRCPTPSISLNLSSPIAH
jgi:hypothetical protein